MKEKSPIVWEKNITTFPSGQTGEHYYDEVKGIHIIRIAPRASTRLRLHELAHAKLQGGLGNATTTDETAHREIEADMWAYSKQGRPYKLYPFLTHVVRPTIQNDARPNTLNLSKTYKYFLDLADEYDFELSEKDKHTLWQSIKEEIRRARNK